MFAKIYHPLFQLKKNQREREKKAQAVQRVIFFHLFQEDRSSITIFFCSQGVFGLLLIQTAWHLIRCEHLPGAFLHSALVSLFFSNAYFHTADRNKFPSTGQQTQKLLGTQARSWKPSVDKNQSISAHHLLAGVSIKGCSSGHKVSY